MTLAQNGTTPSAHAAPPLGIENAWQNLGSYFSVSPYNDFQTPNDTKDVQGEIIFGEKAEKNILTRMYVEGDKKRADIRKELKSNIYAEVETANKEAVTIRFQFVSKLGEETFDYIFSTGSLQPMYIKSKELMDLIKEQKAKLRGGLNIEKDQLVIAPKAGIATIRPTNLKDVTIRTISIAIMDGPPELGAEALAKGKISLHVFKTKPEK